MVRHALLACQSRPAAYARTISTAAYDRGEKFARYRQLESLRAHVLIDPDSASVDLFRRDANGNWVLITAASSGPIELASIAIRLKREAVFASLV
jgi:Uma2 family endonuclease